MTSNKFVKWATKQGLGYETIAQLIQYAATEEEMNEAQENEEPPPPIYSLDDIQGMNEGDPFGFVPLEHGFVLIGGCDTGDPIAIDVAKENGSVWFIGHESMHEKPPRKNAIRVADDVETFMARLGDADFPLDYYDAKHRRK